METPALQSKPAYAVAEIAEVTSLSLAFLRNEIRAGRLRVQRFGRRVLVLDADLRAYLERGSEGEKSRAGKQRAA
jgi:excisionase family DNA binding protein